MKKILMLLLLMPSLALSSWYGTESGRIGKIEVTDAENLGFRVSFRSGKVLCDTYTWAYLNKSDSNYETYVSVLLAARMSDSEVTIFTVKGVGGYCKIGHLYLNI